MSRFTYDAEQGYPRVIPADEATPDDAPDMPEEDE